MAMENDPYNVDQPEGPAPDEQLVAYLDGELDDESSRQIEQRLTSDSALRDQLTRLERTWNALDELEQVEVDEGFTKTTIEMVALAAEEEHQREETRRPARRLRQWLIGSVGLVAACLAGFVGVWGFYSDPNEQVIKDFPIYEKLDEYQQIDDIEFLLLLHKNGVFAAEAEDDDA
jgi:anti-sigma-K factor RskA